MVNKEKTLGEIIKVKKLWWLKINKKTIRKNALDGAVFPSLIKVKYSVHNKEYTKNALIIKENDIKTGQKITVLYDVNNPQKIKIMYTLS